MAQVHLKLGIRFAWWVRPLIHLAKFIASIGIPVDTDRLTEIVVKHGVRCILNV